MESLKWVNVQNAHFWIEFLLRRPSKNCSVPLAERLKNTCGRAGWRAVGKISGFFLQWFTLFFYYKVQLINVFPLQIKKTSFVPCNILVLFFMKENARKRLYVKRTNYAFSSFSSASPHWKIKKKYDAGRWREQNNFSMARLNKLKKQFSSI